MMSNISVVGVIGLGRMGLRLCENLRDKGHKVIGFDLCEKNMVQLTSLQMTPVPSIEELCRRLPSPRKVILMVPAGEPVDAVIHDALPHLAPGDVVIDAGNSFYMDSIGREAILSEREIGFLDMGMSGGLSGARTGACLTIGGDRKLFERFEFLFKDMAQADGYLYVGPPGWGHLIKTIHNGIEYGMLQAIGEGLHVIWEMGNRQHNDLDLSKLCSVWNNGSIIASRLMSDAAATMDLLAEHPEVAGSVGGGETGAWAQEIAGRSGVGTCALDAALEYRRRSHQSPDFTGKVIAAIRHRFGGHQFT